MFLSRFRERGNSLGHLAHNKASIEEAIIIDKRTSKYFLL